MLATLKSALENAEEGLIAELIRSNKQKTRHILAFLKSFPPIPLICVMPHAKIHNKKLSKWMTIHNLRVTLRRISRISDKIQCFKIISLLQFIAFRSRIFYCYLPNPKRFKFCEWLYLTYNVIHENVKNTLLCLGLLRRWNKRFQSLFQSLKTWKIICILLTKCNMLHMSPVYDLLISIF